MHKQGIDILTIGGFDPSNGAGITADVKTFGAFGRQALAVQTALTIQHEAAVARTYWHTDAQVLEQLDMLLERHRPAFVKLSLTRGLAQAEMLIAALRDRLGNATIVWDPVMVASSGFAFYDKPDTERLENILRGIDLATPNRNEIRAWSGDDPEAAAAAFSRITAICLKGGHDAANPGRDLLFRHGALIGTFEAQNLSAHPKHGSGCVFGSALTACLAGGIPLAEGIRKAKGYVEAFLASDPGLLGHHNTKTIAHVETE